jgi:hypothetical protein
MQTLSKSIAPAAAAFSALAPNASTDTNPAVPYGTNPHSPYVLGYHESNHDEAHSSNGFADMPF